MLLPEAMGFVDMYQALRVYFSVLLFLAIPAVLADSSSSTVNERLPVRKAEMEAHWKVDCAGSWANLTELLGRSREGACSIPPGLHREMKLCSFIYQPPGEEMGHFCPDYRGAYLYLEQASRGNRCPVPADFHASMDPMGCQEVPANP